MTMSSPGSGNHCSFVLLAEFDIIEGAQLKYQFPQPLGIDESVLAMSMLPDGAETQLDDWTIFFLNQTEFNTIEPVLALESDSDSYLSEDRSEGGKDKRKKKKELLCVLNLVRTKHDKTLDRGAKVLALAICTRHPYIQIFKPVLLIALDDYLLNPSQDVLARLFDAVNAIDFSVAPVLSRDEKLVMRMSERKDIFAEKHKHLYINYTSSTSQHKSSDSDSSVNNQSSRPAGKEEIDHSIPGDVSFGSAVWVGDESAFDISGTTSDSDGATDGASTVIGSTRQRSSTDASSSSSSSHLHLPRIPISRAGSSFGSHDSTISGTKVGGTSSYTGTGNTTVQDTHFFNTTVEYNDHKLPIKMPLSTFAEEVGDYSLITLIRTFSQPTSSSTSSSTNSSSHPSLIHPHLHTSGSSTHPIIILFNALVTGKNIIFLGHKRPAGEVSLFVLAACSLGSGCGVVLRGFVERAFPYANLNNRDEWESVPAYIAGVTNPIFETSRSWDLLCDISTGTVTVAKDIWTKWPVGPGMGMGGSSNGSGAGLIAPLLTRTGTLKAEVSNDEVQKDAVSGVKGEVKYAPPDSGGLINADNMFIEDIKTAIEFHYGESLVRVRFMEYAMRFVRLASRYEEETYVPGLTEKDVTKPKTKIGYPTSPFKEGQAGGIHAHFGQLGSGLVFNDEALGIKELVANASRIEGWRGTNSYRYYVEDFAHHLAHSPIRNFDVFHQILRLKHASGARKMSDAEAHTIMKNLADGVKGYDQVVELLSYLTPHSGGLLPLAFGLFHQRESVRDATVSLFNQLRAYPVGVLYLQSLNHFQRYAYVRLAHAREVKDRKVPEFPQYPNQQYQSSYSSQQTYSSGQQQQQSQYASVPFGRSHSNSNASLSFGSPLGAGLAMPSSYGESRLNGAY